MFTGILSYILRKNILNVTNNYFWQINAIAQFTMIFLLLIFLYFKKKKNNGNTILYYNKLNKDEIIFAILVILAFGFFSKIYLFLIKYLSEHFKFITFELEKFNYLNEMISLKQNFWMFLSVGFFAPIFEEILIRGYGIKELKKYFSFKTTIFITSLLFGISHLNLVQGIYAFFAGIILGYFYLKYKSITLVIFLHMLNNIPQIISFSTKFEIFYENLYFLICMISFFLSIKFYKKIKK
ncbi:MAG: CPBP family intramembrane glutamic endopeptidase [Peptoniphilaceae bacterium]|nr:CPBP family intramembrane metalloprotease [Peptoniphilaceae bacterium]MDD7383360.1 CPBP family intramembrane metalloprotease [Peptoniphilaceae bacterium]MDY3738269.1 CPBP family intramembrane glutamic endopeptidase [Peptoniphilaceae bacterium]